MNHDTARVACAVAVIVTCNNQVLVGQRSEGDEGPKWQLPGGWIETGESPLISARREVLEHAIDLRLVDGVPDVQGIADLAL